MIQDPLISALQTYSDYAFVMDKHLLNKACVLDLSDSNHVLKTLNYGDPAILNSYIFSFINEKQVLCSVGGYSEDRVIYRSKANFSGIEIRSIHLGIDIWAPAYSSVYAPLDGKVHSFANNSGAGDYGPTIILEHEINNITFHTLYGHLSVASLEGLKEGKPVSKGQKIAALGDDHENGNWPPHLHFQIIKSMDGLKGDYPGVAAPSQKEKYLNNCPNPNLILRIPCLPFLTNLQEF